MSRNIRGNRRGKRPQTCPVQAFREELFPDKEKLPEGKREDMGKALWMPTCGGKEKIQGAGTGRFEGAGIPTLAGGIPRKECMISLDADNGMAMPEQNKKGQQVSRYPIQAGKKHEN